MTGCVWTEGEHGFRRKQERYGSTPHPDPLLGRGAEGNRLGCQPGRLDAVGSSLSQAMKSKYCYWSVCDGAYGAMMEHCVRTARNAGVFKEFHVLTDRPLEGCECYDACQLSIFLTARSC